MFSNYDARRYDPTAYELPPPGKYRATIEEASNTYSKAGNAMIKVVFTLNGKKAKIYHYFVDNEYVQRKLDQFFNSFAIRPGEFDLRNWLDKSGEIQIVHEEQENGRKNAKVQYFCLRETMPEPPIDEGYQYSSDNGGTFVATDDDIPF